jgi:hypothetical protein
MAQRSRFTITVTDDDITKAHRNDSYGCVVVRAIARTLPDAHRIDVDTQTVRFTLGDDRFTFLTPPMTQGYVAAFDAGDPIHPFKFTLSSPHRVARTRKTAAGLAVERARKEQYKLDRATPPRVKSGEAPASASPKVRAAPRSELGEAPGGASPKVPNGPLATAREVYAGEPLAIQEPGRRAPRRVFKSKRREYGARMLRINQG